MSTPTQLALYNQALRLVGERCISTLTDNRPERYALDDIWDEDPVKQMLEETLWTFATCALEWNYSAASETDTGYQYAFTRPPNYVRTIAICSDEYYSSPLYAYVDEGGYWFCDLETIYIKYVSDAAEFGRDYSLWPELFRNCVALKMAVELSYGLTKSQSLQETLMKNHKKYVKEAKSLDAMNKPTAFKPAGSFTRSRQGSRSGHRGTYTKG